jgi:hypothetical protein
MVGEIRESQGIRPKWEREGIFFDWKNVAAPE